MKWLKTKQMKTKNNKQTLFLTVVKSSYSVTLWIKSEILIDKIWSSVQGKHTETLLEFHLPLCLWAISQPVNFRQ